MTELSKGEQSLVFRLLGNQDYNQKLEKLESDFGYDLGDYHFETPETKDKIRRLARLIWCELHGHFK